MGDSRVFDTKKSKALQLVDAGVNHAADSDFESAILCFQESISHYPTAEAYTYWAWMLSFRGSYDQAISLCKKAIEIDPAFGNSYNDIGSYLMKLNKFDDAIAWLEKAKKAARYELRHYPFMNMGRIYMEKGWITRAIEEFQGALKFDPNNIEVKHVLEDLEQSIH